MQTLNVSPRISDVVNYWFDQMLDSVNTVLPRTVLPEASSANEAAATSLGVKELDGSVTLQIGAEPIITLRGILNETNYLTLINYAQCVYDHGHKQITLELSQCTNIKLAGLFALFSIHTLFRGETPPNPEDGWHGLRQMVDQSQRLGVAENVICQNATPKVTEILMKNGLMTCSSVSSVD